MELLSFLANLGSLAGLFFTVWAAWKAYQSKKYYLLVGRVPENIAALREATTHLTQALEITERSELLVALGEMRVASESIARNISKNDRQEFETLVDLIKEIEQRGELDLDELGDLWTIGETLALKAEELVNDAKFSRS